MCLSLAGRVVDVDGERHEATVDVDGSTRRVSLAMLVLEERPVAPGDWVLVHTGLAVDLLDEDRAAELVDLHRTLHGGGTG
ncbi:MAG: HypC/HybG/HupF family hydrogenase formation chaperone [Acidimicrobiia bacterium]|nr:HypC/HybG/HupF family hydrogenase formation chaperone [Acidimicrobiia bacterium]